MEVGEVRVAQDTDFDLLKIYLSRNDGWKLEYDKGDTAVWTRQTPEQLQAKMEGKKGSKDETGLKMIRLKTRFSDVSASVLYDVIQDPDYRTAWDKFCLEIRELGHLNPNNNITYYALSCPPPLKNRDFVIQSSWLETREEYLILSHSVYHKDVPGKKGFVRGITFLTGFHIKREGPNSCSLGYVTHANPRGNLPIWLSNRLSSTFAPKLIRKVHKACLKYPDWKAKQGKKSQLKPWLYPEQISSPRIDVKDCQAPSANGKASSKTDACDSSPESESLCGDEKDNVDLEGEICQMLERTLSDAE